MCACRDWFGVKWGEERTRRSQRWGMIWWKRKENEWAKERKFGISLFLVNFTSTRDLTYVAIACSSNMILTVGPTLFSYYVVIQRTFRNNENHTCSQAFIEVLRRYRSAVESASVITLWKTINKHSNSTVRGRNKFTGGLPIHFNLPWALFRLNKQRLFRKQCCHFDKLLISNPGCWITRYLACWLSRSVSIYFLINNSMEQSLSLEANRFQFVKKFPKFFWTRRFFTGFIRPRHLSLFWARSTQSMFPIPLPEDPF